MSSTIFEREPPAPGIARAALTESVLRPYWLDDARPASEHPALRGRQDADLAVVGGGFAGLWTALRAKEREPSRRVVLLESQRLGWAASGRNGGFCKASLTHGEANGRRRWPDEFDQLERLGERNLDELEQTLVRYGIDCDFERSGLLIVAVEPYQLQELDELPGRLSEAEVRAELNSPTYLGGHWFREGTAMLHPGKLVRGLARAAAALGVELHEATPALGLEPSGVGVRLRTPQGEVQARRVVLATNAFRSLLWRDRLRTIPVYDYVLMTEPLDQRQRAALGWQRRQGVSDMGNQFHYYRITRDHRILFGGYDAIYHFGGRVDPAYEDRQASFERLADHFFTTFPQLEGLRFTHRWGGAIDTSTRFCAYFRQALGGRVVSAAGFTGLGVGATRFAADVLLDLADGLDTERTRLRMVRERPMAFPPEPLAWMAVQGARWSLDRADHREGRRNLLLKALDAAGLGFDS